MFDSTPLYPIKIVCASSNIDENGKKRVPDDWQPRSNIKKLYEQGKLTIDASDAITEFSSKFIVNEKLVRNYIEDLYMSQLQSVNEIRKEEQRKEKQARALKDVHSYDWKTLVEQGKLDTLTVPELDKYIDHHQPRRERKLTKSGESQCTITELQVVLHVLQASPLLRTVRRVTVTMTLFCLYDDSESDSESDCESDDEESHPVTLAESTSRSGCRVGHWSTRYADFVQ